MKKNQIPSQTAALKIRNAVVRAIVRQKPSKTDPNGSYTGRPLDETERPVQDADDL